MKEVGIALLLTIAFLLSIATINIVIALIEALFEDCRAWVLYGLLNLDEKKWAPEIDRNVQEFGASAEEYFSSLSRRNHCVVLLDASCLMKLAATVKNKIWYAKMRGFIFPEYNKRYKRPYMETERCYKINYEIWNRFFDSVCRSGRLDAIVLKCVFRQITTLCDGENTDVAEMARIAKDFIEKQQTNDVIKVYKSAGESEKGCDNDLIEYIRKLKHSGVRVIFLCDDQDLRIRTRSRTEEEGLYVEIKSVHDVETSIWDLHREKFGDWKQLEY